MNWQQTIADFLILKGFDLFGAAVILLVGLLVARTLARILDSWLSKHQLEPPIRMLMRRFVWAMVMAFTLLIVLERIGVPVLSLVAGLSVVGVGVGLAMQGVLGNLIAGLTIIFTKPFRVGEYIDILGNQGQVVAIDLFTTTIQHADTSSIVIPNRKIVGEILHNYGKLRQLDMTVAVTHAADLDKTIAAIRGVLDASPRVVKEPVPVVGVQSVAGPAIIIGVQPWVSVAEYGPATAELYHALVSQFRAERVAVPVSIHEVHLIGDGKSPA